MSATEQARRLTSSAPYVGVDVGASWLHAVSVDPGLRLGETAVFATSELDELVAWAADAKVIAIDAPDRPSVSAHRADPRLAPKFRTGRCAEAALGLRYRYWVPWTTPPAPPPGTWMAVGIALHGMLRARTHAAAIEVFSYAGFRELAGGAHLPKKSTIVGKAARAALLQSAGLGPERLESDSHDALDAALAAVVAVHRDRGDAVPVRCEDGSPCAYDGSVIWLPQREAQIDGRWLAAS